MYAMHTSPRRCIFFSDGCIGGGARSNTPGEEEQQVGGSGLLQPTNKRTEQRYSATELEALALVESIRHFAYYLHGREFVVYTDHKALCQMLTSDRLNPRLRRISLKLQHWLVTIKYLPGRDNGFADALSREEQTWEKRVTPASQEPDVVLQWGMWGYQPTHEEPERETLQRGVLGQENRTRKKWIAGKKIEPERSGLRVVSIKYCM